MDHMANHIRGDDFNGLISEQRFNNNGNGNGNANINSGDVPLNLNDIDISNMHNLNNLQNMNGNTQQLSFNNMDDINMNLLNSNSNLSTPEMIFFQCANTNADSNGNSGDINSLVNDQNNALMVQNGSIANKNNVNNEDSNLNNNNSNNNGSNGNSNNHSLTEDEVYQRRKAQNRAAQRAFRERKEGKLKELSNKLEKAEIARLNLEKQLNELKQKNMVLDMENQILQKQKEQQQYFTESSNSINNKNNNKSPYSNIEESYSSNTEISDANKVLSFKFPNTNKCDFIEGTIDWALHGQENMSKQYSNIIGESYEYEEEKVLTISAVWDYLVEFTELNSEISLDIPGIMTELRGKEICHGFGPAYPIALVNGIIQKHVENFDYSDA